MYCRNTGEERGGEEVRFILAWLALGLDLTSTPPLSGMGSLTAYKHEETKKNNKKRHTEQNRTERGARTAEYKNIYPQLAVSHIVHIVVVLSCLLEK